jgi:CheY-like chemotaxis protein
MSQEKKVMIVDDEPASIKLFQEALKEINIKSDCQTASDGKDAFEKLKSKKEDLPELVFLDLNMPRMNGREFLAKFKKEKTYKHIPVIIWTTSSAQKDIDETTALGASYYLIKPNRFEDLCNQIKLVMEIDWKRPNEWTDAKAGLK